MITLKLLIIFLMLGTIDSEHRCQSPAKRAD